MTKKLVQPENVFVYLATDLKKLTDKYGKKATDAWANFFDKNDENLKFAPDESLLERIDTPSEWTLRDPSPPFKHSIVGIPGTTSCYLKQGISFDITDWESEDVAAVRVMLQYISDQMYNLIRGKGLTYGVSMSSSVTEGRMRLKFSRYLDIFCVLWQVLNIDYHFLQVQPAD